ncbi:MAG: hypothetical protein ACLRIT_07620 [Blautia sp.]
MDFDFFEVLDSVTIARSRKHISKHYSTAEIGKVSGEIEANFTAAESYQLKVGNQLQSDL